MDYWNGTTTATISLAVIKQPASVRVDDARYRGPILVNPGGPGGSGVRLVQQAGRIIQSLVQGNFPNLDSPHFYDVVGFDPRAVGQTLPTISWLDPFEGQIWRKKFWEIGTMRSSDVAFDIKYATATAFGERCSNLSDAMMQQYATTAYVARDMLERVEALARSRQMELRKLNSDITIVPGKEQLQYWGFSYGTHLGYTFASMFPDRVGRLALDGVMDPEDYTSNHWTTDITDTEKCFDTFGSFCAAAGYPKCPLADINEPSKQQVKTRLLNIIRRLQHEPLPTSNRHVEIVTYSDMRYLLFTSLYSPVASFPPLADALAELEHGRANVAAKMIRPYLSIDCNRKNNYKYVNTSVTDVQQLIFYSIQFSPSQAFIMCTDADPITNRTKAHLRDRVDRYMGISPTAGDIWADVPAMCYHYDVQPVYRYTGPWKGDTANPILLIGNTADPITPLMNSHSLASRFSGARVLTLESPGHTSTSAFSECIFSHLAQYFSNGTMPEEGTICKPDVVPWGPDASVTAKDSNTSKSAMLHRLVGEAMLAAGGGRGLI